MSKGLMDVLLHGPFYAGCTLAAGEGGESSRQMYNYCARVVLVILNRMLLGETRILQLIVTPRHRCLVSVQSTHLHDLCGHCKRLTFMTHHALNLAALIQLEYSNSNLITNRRSCCGRRKVGQLCGEFYLYFHNRSSIIGSNCISFMFSLR